MLPRHVVALSVLLSGSWPAYAYRDLTGCPDLLPINPLSIAAGAPASCAEAVAKAGRRYVERALGAHRRCFDRVLSGAVTEPAPTACLGVLKFASSTRILPTDPDAAERLTAAEAELTAAVVSACDAPSAAALGSCGATPDALAACVLADHREHVTHMLERQYGEAAAVADPVARSCQRAVARGGQGFVRAVLAAQARCLARFDSASGWHPARQCLGSIELGVDVPPEDARTAGRLSRAREKLAARLTRVCTPAALAALDACGADPATATDCLACSHRREALLMTGAERGGVADRPTTHFVNWATLQNPVLANSRLLKNQAVVFDGGWFYFFVPGALLRTQDFIIWEDVSDPDVPGYFGDVSRFDGIWHQTTNCTSPTTGEVEICMTTSPDLINWPPRVSITPALLPNSIIDGALERQDGYYFLAFKDRVLQKPFVTRSLTGAIDGTWEPPVRAIAGSDDPVFGFSEAFHFLRADGTLRVIGTGRDPERYRCAEAIFIFYTCDHEPWIYSIEAPTADLASWTQWRHAMPLRIPFESWNTIMHANSGHLADWRTHDGFFYLSYSGSDDGTSFNYRGHGKIGLARSRDLVHWRVPGDLRD